MDRQPHQDMLKDPLGPDDRHAVLIGQLRLLIARIERSLGFGVRLRAMVLALLPTRKTLEHIVADVCLTIAERSARERRTVGLGPEILMDDLKWVLRDDPDGWRRVEKSYRRFCVQLLAELEKVA